LPRIETRPSKLPNRRQTPGMKLFWNRSIR
jgi:hypothetical protein